MGISVVFRIAIDILVVTAIILFLPGIPPRVKFEPYDITPPLSLEGPLSQNAKLDLAEFLYEGKFTGPESIATRKGEIYTGLIGGDIVRIKRNGEIQVIARFGKRCEGKWQESICGRPLGMRFDSNGKLVVSDAYYGIYRVDVDTEVVEELVSSKDVVDGRPMMTLNDLDIAKDGTIYFSDSSHVSLQNSMIEFLGEPTGRLLKYDPKTKKVSVLLRNIHFANGVQLSKNEDFVLVSETCRSRLIRYHLRGDKMGENDTFIDGLPGAPDNIRSDENGGFLIALSVPRTEKQVLFMDILSNYPLTRKFILRITTVIHSTISFFDSIFPNEYTGRAKYYINHLEPAASIIPDKASIIVQLDGNGRIKTSLHNSVGRVQFTSEVTLDEAGIFAYLGSPYNHGIWRIRVKDMGLK